MIDRNDVHIRLTSEERQQIEEIVRVLGYDTPADFMLDVLRRVMRERSHFSVVDMVNAYKSVGTSSDSVAEEEGYDFDTKEGILAGLRESWHQAMTGNTRPVSELWDALNEE